MIPLFRPSCSDLEIRNVTEVLRSGWWSCGPKVAELEEEFAKRTNIQHAVAVSNCTSALQIACEALGVRGGEVIIPALTFAATGLSVLHSGAQIVFADINEDTLCIDWEDADRKVNSRTRAIIPVWYGGKTAAIAPYCRHSPPIIEDCAHAAGSLHAGYNGVAACWSFNAVKNLASGDGGMITTNDAELADRIRKLRRFGIDKEQSSWDYNIPVAGWKADMNDITAALALAQLARLDEMNELRRKIVLTYMKEFRDLDWLKLPSWDAHSSWHMFVARTQRRDDLITHLLRWGVSAGVHYKPLNQHGIFGEYQELPVTDRVWKTLVTLPLYPDMTENDVEQVVDAVRSFRV